MIVDELGYVPLSTTGAELLFEVFSQRYERGSILLTSNRAPAEWPDWFANPLLASAGLDRLLHHADTLILTSSSYRAKGRHKLEVSVN